MAATQDIGAGITKELSGEQVQAASGGCAIVRYPDLADYPSWEAFMSESKGKAAVLFCTDSPTDGHWLAAFNGPDGPHVFDPLGLALDSERKLIGPEAAAELGQSQPQFKRLLDGQKCHVSRFDYQKDKPGINTCGRWTALRLKNSDATDAQFHDWVVNTFKRSGLPTMDAWVVTVI
jgi:hypothetical protein